jgi:hypothetical protein
MSIRIPENPKTGRYYVGGSEDRLFRWAGQRIALQAGVVVEPFVILLAGCVRASSLLRHGNVVGEGPLFQSTGGESPQRFFWGVQHNVGGPA